jgi:hypothetical protein
MATAQSGRNTSNYAGFRRICGVSSHEKANREQLMAAFVTSSSRRCVRIGREGGAASNLDDAMALAVHQAQR